MKKIILLIMLVMVSLLSAETVNGDTLRINGFKVVKVWGNHHERGYAYGNLMAGSVVDLFINYVMPNLYNNNATIYNYGRNFYLQKFTNDQVLKNEAGAMIRGMRSAGVNLVNTVLGRELDSIDILMVNSVPDMSALGKDGPASAPGCADLVSWGAATNVSLEQGTLVTRHLDWDNNIYLKKNAIIYVHFPSEENEQNWAGFGFAGLFGALSGVSESGTITYQNQSNYAQTPVGSDFYPINLAQRRGLELCEYDGDGVSTFKDVFSFIRTKQKAYSYIITAVSKIADGNPFVLECKNNKVDSARTKANNTADYSDNLIVTNHHRVLFPPVGCYRYANINDSLLANSVMTPDRSWKLLAGAAGHSGTLQTIQFIPSQLKLRLAFSIPNGVSSYAQQPKEILLSQLFEPVSINQGKVIRKIELSAYPNPFNPATTISFDSRIAGVYSLNIYDIQGRLVEKRSINSETGLQKINWQATNQSSGIYYAVIKDAGNNSLGMTRLVLIK